MYCQKCGAELQDGAKFCSKCGAEQSIMSSTQINNINTTGRTDNQMAASVNNNFQNNQMAKNSKKGCFIIAIVALVVFVIVMIFSCVIINLISGFGNSTYEMGESAVLDDLKISVTSYETVYSIASDRYIANDGMIYAVVGVTVYNDGNEGRSFMDSIRSYAVLTYEDKEFSNKSFLVPPSDLFDSTYFAPMVSKEGYIVFEIPEQLSNHEDEIMIKFIKDNGGLDGNEMEWKEDIDYVEFNIE